MARVIICCPATTTTKKKKEENIRYISETAPVDWRARNVDVITALTSIPAV